jgi:hypothetical protein
MGKLRDLRIGAVRRIREQLPPHVVEAEVTDAFAWCTATATVLLQQRGRQLQMFTLTPRFDAYVAPVALFGPHDRPDAVAEAVIAGLTRVGHGSRVSALQPATGTICGTSTRGGVDIAIMSTQKRLEAFHYELRAQIEPLTLIDDDAGQSMLERYVLYLSLLVDQAQSAVAMLVSHGQDIGAVLHHRLLVEYAVRARYALRHRDYTLWLMTISEAEENLKRLELSNADEADLVNARKHRDVTVQRFSDLLPLAKANNWKNLQFRTMFEYVATTAQHVSLYKYPSVFIHADPIGMRYLFRENLEGKLEGVTRLQDAELNSDMVDATAMLLEFFRSFIDTFPSLLANGEMHRRLADLDRENMVHMLRYQEGRSRDFIEEAKRELGLVPSVE